MSHVYASRQKHKSAPPAHRTATGNPASNPAIFSAPEQVGMGEQLGDLMRMRMQQQFSDHQIPSAEREADRLSAGLGNARTPDEVKAAMGAKLGADFSEVHFHTGAAAAKTSDTIGARAYTTGSDVYFGSGGFSPALAAHELVHTVQQGTVAGTVPTVSAPAGQVQMAPVPLSESLRYLNKASREKEDEMAAYHVLRKKIHKLHKQEKAGTLSDKDREMLEALKNEKLNVQNRSKSLDKDYHEAKASGSLYKMLDRRNQELNDASDFSNQYDKAVTSKLTEEPSEQRSQKGKTAREKTDFAQDLLSDHLLDDASMVTDTVQLFTDKNSVHNDRAGKGSQGLSGIAAVNDIVNLGKAAYDFNHADNADAEKEAKINGGKSAVSAVANTLGAAGLDQASSGVSIVTDIADLAEASVKTHKDRKAKKATVDVENKMLGGGSLSKEEKAQKRKEMNLETRALLDTAGQTHSVNNQNLTQDGFDIATASLNTASDIAGASGAEDWALGLKATSKIVNGVGKAVTFGQKKNRERMVSAQATGADKDMIESFRNFQHERKIQEYNKQYAQYKKDLARYEADPNHVKKPKEPKKPPLMEDYSRSKQALLKLNGAVTGDRKEMAADQTEKRAELLLKMAQDPKNENRQYATDLLQKGLQIKGDVQDMTVEEIMEQMLQKDYAYDLRVKKYGSPLMAQLMKEDNERKVQKLDSGTYLDTDHYQRFKDKQAKKKAKK